MKLPSRAALEGRVISNWDDPADAELFGRAADHMLLLWAFFHEPVLDTGSHSIFTLLDGPRDSFGCPILPADLRDKLRELYMNAAKEKS